MPKKQRYPKTSPKQWVKQLFLQPNLSFYQQPALYMSGAELELQNFRAVLEYTPEYLLIDLRKGRLRITGDMLVIIALEKTRLILRGHILGISFLEE